MREKLCLGTLALLTALTACQDEVPNPGEVDDRTPTIADTPPPAISGGTMLVLADGRVLVADADRDRVHIVSITPARFDADILFEPGVEPGRSVEGSEGVAHVILRGAGDVVALDTVTGEILDRRHLCTDPRGVDCDESTELLYVACADGTLLSMPELGNAGIDRHFIEPDLRDVIVEGDRLLVSHLRSTKILELSKVNFAQVNTREPQPQFDAVPTVSWRMVESRPGELMVLHQYASTTPVPITPPPDDTGGDDHGDEGAESGGDAPYGGGGGFCEPGIVSPGVSVWNDGSFTSSRQLIAPTPAVDIAADPVWGTYAIAIAGAPEGERDIHFSDGEDPCFDAFNGLSTPGQPVAVAYLPDGRLLVQSREPSALYVYNQDRQHELTVELSTNSRFDTGHDLYHVATDASIACASCHPEATDDGHVWVFEELGPRRTQSPEVGLEGSAPFHWEGDMDDFHTLSDEVYSARMGGPRQSEERAAAFAKWMFSAERPPAGTLVAEDVRASGEQLFLAYGCASCHSGEHTTNNKTVDIRGMALQVPSLRRISLHPPFMHDGRSKDLNDAIIDMLQATQPELDFSNSDVDAIATYLRTL